MKKTSIFACGIFLVLATVALKIALVKEPEPSSSVRQAIPADVTRSAEPQHGITAPAPEIVQTPANLQIGSSSLAKTKRLMSLDQPYAELIAIYQRGGPGAYAIVRDIVMECRLASQAIAEAKAKGLLQGLTVPLIDQPEVQNNIKPQQISAELQSRRVAAVQTVESRCSPILSDSRLYEPHPGDVEGKRLQEFRKQATSDRSKVDQYLNELLSQGAPLTDGFAQQELLVKNIDQLAGLNSSWQYQGLLALTNYSLKVSDHPPGNDIASLGLCVSHGACDGRVDQIPLEYFKIPRGSPAHKRVIELLPKMKAILGG